ncbi:hypothetical protein CLNEO_00130 [Anaerotignum neopropionicum]|uniref:TIGR02453 family protein n=1 Tax=Anaerotignum neopropionicum TaxID=36847 RepID=A0A136WHB7_9FIRM|nr:DUF2461 domain-containing protein [Anaerotignum neopropionicum]KXL53921.1 hypothetical protein CLNEO_00130 [Anaerotignum neopropionicum]
MKEFTGFMPETIDFLWELRMNNNKEWMDQNRERYKAVLKDPFDRFAMDMGEQFAESTGEKMNWAISRINRDIRFSKDKSPYRACRWVVFKEPLSVGTEWKLRPAFYFELSPEGYNHGMGVYEATPAYLNAYRDSIQKKPRDFADIVRGVEREGIFTLMGEDYKKVDASALPREIHPWYVKKNFYLAEEKKMEDIIFSPQLPQMLAEKWKKLIPLYRYLKEIKAE